MDEHAASWVFKFLREGGALAGLVLSLLANIWFLRTLLASNQRHADLMTAEQREHRLTAEKVSALASELVRLNGELNVKILRRRAAGGG